MKKYLSIILFSFLSAYAFGCSPIFLSYFIEDGKMYFGQWRSSDKLEVFGIDTTTFVQDPKCSLYGKDKNYVYYEGQILPQANPDTFVFLGGIPTLSGKEGYSKDDKNVFFRNKRLEFADFSTFEVILPVYNFAGVYDSGYGKDKNQVYNYGSVLPVDVSSFRILGWGYTADKSGIYYEGKPLEGSDRNKYKHNKMYLVTNNKVYISGIEQTLYDGASFEVLDINMTERTSCGGILMKYTLTKDKNGVYINNNQVSSIDGETFKFETSNLFSDINGLYQIVFNNAENRYVLDKISFGSEGFLEKRIIKLKDYIYIVYNDKDNVCFIKESNLPSRRISSFGTSNRDLKNISQKYNIDTSSFDVYFIADNYVLFKDNKYLYLASGKTDELKIIPIQTQDLIPIYILDDVFYLVGKDRFTNKYRLFSIYEGGYSDEPVDSKSIVVVNADADLIGQGYLSFFLADKDYIYQGKGLFKRKITDSEYLN